MLAHISIGLDEAKAVIQRFFATIEQKVLSISMKLVIDNRRPSIVGV